MDDGQNSKHILCKIYPPLFHKMVSNFLNHENLNGLCEAIKILKYRRTEKLSCLVALLLVKPSCFFFSIKTNVQQSY